VNHSQRQSPLTELLQPESDTDIFFNLSPDLVCIFDAEGNFQKLNPAWESLLGWTEPELISHPWHELIHPDELAATLTAFQTWNPQQIFLSENRYRHKNGSYRWLSWRVIQPPQGLFYAIGKDISKHKQAQQELQRLTAQVEQQTKTLNEIVSASPDQMYMFDTPNRYAYASLAGAKALGLQRSDMVGKTWQELGLSAEYMEPMCLNHQQVFATGNSLTDETALPTINGLRHFEYIVAPIHALDGEVAAVVSTFRDITERKLAAAVLEAANEQLELRVEARTAELWQANEQLRTEISDRHRVEAALRESEERFRRIFDDAPIGIALVRKPDQQFLMVNRAFCAILGYTPSELTALNLTDITHPEDIAQETVYIKQVLQAEIDSYQYEKRYIRKNKEICWVRSTTTVIRSEHQEILYKLCMVEDITEQKRAEEEIHKALEKERELNELRSRFITTVSHEFRTPLSIIILAAKLLEHFNQQASEERKREYFERIQAAAQNMTHLLDDVLFIGKADAGKLQFNPTFLDLEKFCQEMIADFQFTGTQHRIAFNCKGHCRPASIDEKLLRQIITNLLSNAIKYSQGDSKIQFNLICEPDFAIFQFRDEGIGIPVLAQSQLFESFHRADNVGTIPGTGLGLSIVKKCVDLQGGHIKVNSEVGVGTTFTVILPLNHAVSEVDNSNQVALIP
jgi:PAS domain S-box-containing protein